jgi:hypothetical protein
MPFLEQVTTRYTQGRTSLDLLESSEAFLDDIEETVVVLWKAMKDFFARVNRATKSKRKLPELTLVQATTAFMYRLLHTGFTPDSLDEAVRLALVAICCRAFLEPPTLSIQNTTIPRAYRYSLLQVDRLAKAYPNVQLWLFMVGAVCLFGESDHVWLFPRIRSGMEMVGVRTWNELVDSMKKFIWVDILFNQRAREIHGKIELHENISREDV